MRTNGDVTRPGDAWADVALDGATAGAGVTRGATTADATGTGSGAGSTTTGSTAAGSAAAAGAGIADHRKTHPDVDGVTFGDDDLGEYTGTR